MKEYNDFNLASEQNYTTMQQAYAQSEHNDINDLQEILNKMIYQKDALESENTNGEFVEIINNINEDIAELNGILHSTRQASTLKKQPHKQSLSHKVVSRDGLKAHSQYSNQLKSTSLSNSKTHILQQRHNNTTLFRRLSSRIYRNLTRLRCGCNRHDCEHDFRHNRSEYLSPNNTTPSPFFSDISSPNNNTGYGINFDNGLNITSQCNSRRKIHTNQLDIVRLLLLFMALRPSYPYSYRICSLTLRQFEILTKVAP